MTNDEITWFKQLVDRIETLSDPAMRRELEAAIPRLRAQGGPAARLADEVDAALRDWEKATAKIDAACITDIVRLQSTDN
jgi:hypothetical protein